jgi:hypothetical protein
MLWDRHSVYGAFEPTVASLWRAASFGFADRIPNDPEVLILSSSHGVSQYVSKLDGSIEDAAQMISMA